MNKHIEEMAKLCTYHHKGECLACANHPVDCDLMCEMFGVFANLEKEGYRKTSAVAREIFEEIGKIRLQEIRRCEIIREKEHTHTQRNYWEGGANSLRQLSHKFAELKKKYESEGAEDD